MKFRPMKSACFLVALLLLWSQFSVAQKHVRQPRPFAGTVVDAVTNTPVPKALVVGSRGSTWADEWGAFLFAGLVPLAYRLQQPEVVWVSAPGYESRQWPLVDTVQPVIRLLARQHPQSTTACVSASDTFTVRTCESAWFFGGGRPGQRGYQSLYFENPQPHQPGIIRSITLDIARTGFLDVPFRLRVHAVSASGVPGLDILTENLVLCLYTDPFRKDSFVTYDISDYAIPVPESGFYLGLEAVEMWDRPCIREPTAGLSDGLVARPPCAFAKCRTWTWHRGQTDVGGSWTTLAENCWPRFEEALSVEVAPAPAKR